MGARILLSWSGGKDSAWTLYTLRQRGAEVVALLTTLNQDARRVSMQGIRRSLLRVQAAAAGLPVWEVPLPWPCPNPEYERRMAAALARARERGATQVAFGDLFLEDVRAYREEMMAGTGLEPLFPIWTGDPAETPRLARRMLQAGLRATLTCVDPEQVAPSLAGRPFDRTLLSELPEGVDPLGENGEFHTFCHAGPMLVREIHVRTGPVIRRDGFVFADLLPIGILLSPGAADRLGAKGEKADGQIPVGRLPDGRGARAARRGGRRGGP